MKLMPKPVNKKRIMVFGTFDLLHPGHISFLKQAKRRGEELIVGVASDRIVRMLKNKTPRHNEEKRRKAVRALGVATRVVLGDNTLGAYAIVKKHKPDIICLGYDQHALKKDLESSIKNGGIPKIHLITLKPHFSHKFKTSILEKII